MHLPKVHRSLVGRRAVHTSSTPGVNSSLRSQDWQRARLALKSLVNEGLEEYHLDAAPPALVFESVVDELNLTEWSRKNCLGEVLQALRSRNKGPEDVRFVTDGASSCTWEVFAWKANRVYDTMDVNAINLDLKIVGDTWWLQRETIEYCGYGSFWKFYELPKVTPISSVAPVVFTEDYTPLG